MSQTYIPVELRRFVIFRAEEICEYCLTHEEDTFLGCQIDHIISEKHGGATTAENLAYACAFCNFHKGSDIGSIRPGRRVLTRFFNPRIEKWAKHFTLNPNGILIASRTSIGEATARIFSFNSEERLEERAALRQTGRYPTPAAWKRIRGK